MNCSAQRVLKASHCSSFLLLLMSFLNLSVFRLRSSSGPFAAQAFSRLSARRPFALQKPPKTLIFAGGSDQNFYITTPIYYVNGLPHLGHAYTSVLTDIIARFYRQDNANVYFLTGTDEHGQKVQQSATNNQKSPIQFADEMSSKFRSLVQKLDCSHDDFIRTTEERHKIAVAELWKRLQDNNQIYLGAYEGWYSIRDEAFYQESELVGGRAPTGAEVEWVKEESYFFRLSEWTDKLLKFYDENPQFIGPKGRRNEVVSFLSQEGGLKDLSISRTTFTWGIPVPNDPKHVIYVWLDALTNYLSAVGFPNDSSSATAGVTMDATFADDKDMFSKFWPASVHVVGKDILRFHAVYWPAFLMAADIEPPKRIFAHGWWTRDGEKMSKSVGNVLDPFDLIDSYGVDYVRYYMASEIHFGNDGDFSHEAFCAKINSDLANDLGNLAQRALVMVKKHCDSKVPTPGTDFTAEDQEVFDAIKQTLPTLRGYVQEQSMKNMCDAIIQLAKLGNKYIDTQAPWVLAKTDQARMFTVLYVLMELIRSTTLMLSPVIPTSCNVLLDQLGVSATARRFADIAATPLVSGNAIGEPSPVFPKLEPPLPSTQQTVVATAAITVASFPQYDGLPSAELEVAVAAVGDRIRKLKAEKVGKSDLAPHIEELKYLKSKLEVVKENMN